MEISDAAPRPLIFSCSTEHSVVTSTLLATIIVIGVIGLVLDALLKVIEKRILKYWGGEE